MLAQFQHNLKFTESESSIKGFQEAVFSVTDLEKMVSLFQRICGWEIISRNHENQALNQLWHLNDHVEIEQVLMHNKGDHEGFLRIVKFKNVKQQQIRSGAHAWDSGGIFDINIRTPDMDAFYEAFQKEGWNAYADPLRYTFNIYDVSEVLLKGPHGITIAAMQRFAPPLTAFPHMKKTSRIFNSSIICRDMDESKNFYINQLEFNLFFQTAGNTRNGTQNVLGFPQNVNKDITVPIDIVRPDKDNYGSIEYLAPQEFKGKDCSALAHPPNLGILMLRFPVRNAEAYAKKIVKNGAVLTSPLQEMDLHPYGRVKIFAVRSPEGAWLEFIELVDKGSRSLGV